MDPERRSVHPHARALTDAGHSSKFPERPMSRAIVGKLTMRIPPSMEVMREMQLMMPMMTAALHVEIECVLTLVRDSEDSLRIDAGSGATFIFFCERGL